MSSATLPTLPPTLPPTLRLVTDLRSTDRAAPFRLGYRPALAGVRGVAILSVLAFHTHHIFGWSLLKGANAGVDIFFVLSGFLITTLLVEEWQDTGTVSLKSFYWRRALRLVPALLLLLLSLYFLSDLLFLSAEASDTRRGIPVAFVYVSDIALAFFQVRLGALQHTWSLAIEEHFYLIWPLLLVGALKLGITRKRLVIITLLVALASALQRASLHELGALPVRTYYGIDTRADALLIGCATALCVSWGFVRASRFKLFLIPALLLIGFCMALTGYGSSFMSLGGFTLLACATAVVLINVVLSPISRTRAVLEWRLLVWVGRISYGLYLWHYPVFKATNYLAVSWPLQLTVALAATMSVTCLSYYLIERPALRLKNRRLEFSL